MGNFVDKRTGLFYGWFNGRQNLIDQAKRQIIVAGDAYINWYFSDQHL